MKQRTDFLAERFRCDRLILYHPPLLRHTVESTYPRIPGTGQIYKLCQRCKAECIKVEELACPDCLESIMLIEVTASTKPIESTTKVCQTCLDRGYTPARKATKVWTNGSPICDECYAPMVENLLQVPNHSTDIEFSKFTSDEILENREQFFNNHHTAIVNLSYDEIVSILENYKKILYTIRIYAENAQVVIDSIKRKERAATRTSDLAYDARVPSKATATAKLKLNKEEKLRKQMAKTLGISEKQLEMLGKQARNKEFTAVANNENCSACGKTLITCQCKSIAEQEALKAQTPKLCPMCKVAVVNVLLHIKECRGKQ